MKTVLSFTPISGKCRDKIVLPSTPELQAGFYRLEGATASIRVKHVFEVTDLADALVGMHKTETCTVKIKGTYANIPADSMMVVLRMVTMADKPRCATIIQDILMGCSRSRALEIAEDLVGY